MKTIASLLIILVATEAQANKSTPSVVWSALRQKSKDVCVWVKGTPDKPGEAKEVARFRGPCIGGSVSWSKPRGVVTFLPAATESHFKMDGYPKAAFDLDAPTKRAAVEVWRVDLKANPPKAKRIDNLPPGPFQRAGVTGNGDILVLTMEPIPESSKAKVIQDKDGSTIYRHTYKGKTYDFTNDSGQREVAFAYKLDVNGRWQQIEARATTSGWDLAAMTGALSASNDINSCIPPADEGRSDRGLDPVKDAALIKDLPGAVPPGIARGDWSLVSRPGLGDILTHMVNFEFIHPTGLIFFRKAGAKKFVALAGLGFNAGNMTKSTRFGSRYLIASPTLGAHPRIYDLKTGALLFKADDLFDTQMCANWGPS